MQNVRVVQRNLVYVVGLALELCHEDLLKTDKYVGQFGKIIKASIHNFICQLSTSWQHCLLKWFFCCQDNADTQA